MEAAQATTPIVQIEGECVCLLLDEFSIRLFYDKSMNKPETVCEHKNKKRDVCFWRDWAK